MSGFDTPLNSAAIALWAAAVIGLLLWSFLRIGQAVGWRYRLTLGVLRVLATAAVLVLALQPYSEKRTPDREGFRVAVLADASHSMTVRDVEPDSERIDVVREALSPADGHGFRERVAAAYRTEAFLFSSDLRPIPQAALTGNADPVGILPGKTAIGKALLDVLQRPAPAPLGAVLLLTDGNSNDGPPPTEVCKLYRQRGIPVTCVGIGDVGHTADMAVRFTQETFEGVKGQKLNLTATVTSSFSRPHTVTLVLSEDGSPLETSTIEVSPGEPAQVTFSPTPWRAGFRSYALACESPEQDRRHDNDLDFAAVRVREPDTFRLLYLGGYAGWEYKFLKILCDEREQLQLACIIRTGPENYYSVGFPEGVREGTAGFDMDANTLNLFDAILLDTRALASMTDETVRRIANFIDYRGGGMLAFGPLDGLPQVAQDLLPVGEVDAGMLRGEAHFDVKRNFIFKHDRSGALRSPEGFTIFPGEPVWLGGDAKRGARAAAVLRDGQTPVLLAQSYGSGRSAYLSLEHTWRWRMADVAGENAHRAFWQGLLIWLSSASKPRVQAECDGAKVGIGEEVDLAVDVLGTDFRPSPDARVTATITREDGDETPVLLDPSAEIPGRYTAVYFPEAGGRHSVRYDVQLPKSKLTHKVTFLARQTGVESRDTSYREDQLRDIARITGGAFHRYPELRSLERFPLSEHIPMTVTRRYWCETWIPLLLLAAFLAAEWYLRRRIGLK